MDVSSINIGAIPFVDWTEVDPYGIVNPENPDEDPFADIGAVDEAAQHVLYEPEYLADTLRRSRLQRAESRYTNIIARLESLPRGTLVDLIGRE